MLAILTTHPIQYQVPLWQELAKEGSVPFEVWYLTDHGTKVSYDVQFGKSFAWDIDTLSGYPYRFLPVNASPQVSVFHRLYLKESLGKFLEERQIKALWIQGWQVLAYWQAAWQAYQAGVTVWMRGETNDLRPIATWKKPLKKLLLGKLFTRISYFLYIGQANARFYQQYGVQPTQLYPAGYCVDNSRFATQAAALQAQRQALRRQWQIPEGAICLLFAGKFIAKKRPLDILLALQEDSFRNAPVHVLFVGSGELGEQLRQGSRVVYDEESSTQVAITKAADNDSAFRPSVSFAGFLNQTEISQAYVAADCLILPSDFGETWGLVVNEGMASGLPAVVSHQVGCAADLVRPGETGFVYECGNIEQLRAVFKQMLAQPEQLERMGSNARQWIQNWSYQQVISSIKQVYTA
jgi:glycosyltransferase involved in cell wall biosynthesis